MSEFLENQACEAIAQAVASEHSPATGKAAVWEAYERGAIAAAEEIARRINARQGRILEEVDRGGD